MTQLKALRELRGLTQEALATQVGISTSTVQKHEQGVLSNVSLNIALPIARALSVSVEELCAVEITVSSVIQPPEVKEEVMTT
ncbi:helix-turn-helix transcriptional regulator [Deinococcus radiomollis]|uniref:helix-turn-helix transcriptional regulator n=1 Tax=Deinococcus radiomollis TaxID=468916 RepID=UPI00389267B2